MVVGDYNELFKQDSESDGHMIFVKRKGPIVSLLGID